MNVFWGILIFLTPMAFAQMAPPSDKLVMQDYACSNDGKFGQIKCADATTKIRVSVIDYAKKAIGELYKTGHVVQFDMNTTQDGAITGSCIAKDQHGNPITIARVCDPYFNEYNTNHLGKSCGSFCQFSATTGVNMGSCKAEGSWQLGGGRVGAIREAAEKVIGEIESGTLNLVQVGAVRPCGEILKAIQLSIDGNKNENPQRPSVRELRDKFEKLYGHTAGILNEDAQKVCFKDASNLDATPGTGSMSDDVMKETKLGDHTTLAPNSYQQSGCGLAFAHQQVLRLAKYLAACETMTRAQKRYFDKNIGYYSFGQLYKYIFINAIDPCTSGDPGSASNCYQGRVKGQITNYFKTGQFKIDTPRNLVAPPYSNFNGTPPVCGKTQ